MAIRRKSTSNRSRTPLGGSAPAVAQQTTTWDWMVPNIPIAASVNFSFDEYNLPESLIDQPTNADVLEFLAQGNFNPCSFPVFPTVSIQGAIVKTNIPDFVQNAGLSGGEIPAQVRDSVQLVSDKGHYRGCDNNIGTPPFGDNFSQQDVTINTLARVTAINAINTAEVAVLIALIKPAQDIFVQEGEPFFPFPPPNGLVGPQSQVPFIGETYLNKGSIKVYGVRARHNPTNKITSPTGCQPILFEITD